MYSLVLKTFNIKSNDIYNNSNDLYDNSTALGNNSKDSSYNISVSSNDNISKTKKKFKLIISEEKWSQIKPISQTYGQKGRRYMTLQLFQ